MSRRERHEGRMEVLQPVRRAQPRRPWALAGAAFALAAVATLVVLAAAHPFHPTPTDTAAYDDGFAAGLRDGTAEARAAAAQAEAIAYRRGRQATPADAPAGAPSLVELLRRVGSGEAVLNARTADEDATFRRGYLVGYAAAPVEGGAP